MVKSVITLPQAEQDIADAYDWYEEQELGLGEEFLRCVDACCLNQDIQDVRISRM